MISNKLHKAIQDLGKLSSTARVVAARLQAPDYLPVTEKTQALSSDSGAASEETAARNALQVQVTELQKLVARLRTLLDDDLPDAEFTDVQSHAFTERFIASLGTTHPAVLARAYNTEYFKSIPRNIRTLMATALLNYSIATPEFIAPDVWGSLIANSGYLNA